MLRLMSMHPMHPRGLECITWSCPVSAVEASPNPPKASPARSHRGPQELMGASSGRDWLGSNSPGAGHRIGPEQVAIPRSRRPVRTQAAPEGAPRQSRPRPRPLPDATRRSWQQGGTRRLWNIAHYQFGRRSRSPRRANRSPARRPAHHDALRPRLPEPRPPPQLHPRRLHVLRNLTRRLGRADDRDAPSCRLAAYGRSGGRCDDRGSHPAGAIGNPKGNGR
jgi:hypothetical protein